MGRKNGKAFLSSLTGKRPVLTYFINWTVAWHWLLMSLSVFSVIGFPADIFGDLFGGMFGGSPFGGGPFGFGSRGSRRKQKGEDIVHQLKSVPFKY